MRLTSSIDNNMHQAFNINNRLHNMPLSLEVLVLDALALAGSAGPQTLYPNFVQTINKFLNT